MNKAPTSGRNTTAAADVEANGASFARHLRAVQRRLVVASHVVARRWCAPAYTAGCSGRRDSLSRRFVVGRDAIALLFGDADVIFWAGAAPHEALHA